MTQDDDPHNRALHSNPDGGQDGRPSHMTLEEWQRLQLLRSMRASRTGPFQPSIHPSSSSSSGPTQQPKCQHCSSPEIDFSLHTQLKCAVCYPCKDKYPERYSLLTKTEVKADYLLTEGECRDEDLLPHIEKPNPHKRHWGNMWLFLRCQVEEYAFGAEASGAGGANAANGANEANAANQVDEANATKSTPANDGGPPSKTPYNTLTSQGKPVKYAGGAAELDALWAHREELKRKRKEGKFKKGLEELRKKTRVEAWRRRRDAELGDVDGVAGDGRGGGGGGGMGTGFGAEIKKRGIKHEHVWGRAVDGEEEGVGVKRCVECGMEVEELEF